MTIPAQSINIYWDDSDQANKGWAYRVAGAESGPVDGSAADAINRICDLAESEDGDYQAIIDTIGAMPGDRVHLIMGGTHMDLAVLMGMDR
jgi:hypothetical protein